MQKILGHSDVLKSLPGVLKLCLRSSAVVDKMNHVSFGSGSIRIEFDHQASRLCEISSDVGQRSRQTPCSLTINGSSPEFQRRLRPAQTRRRPVICSFNFHADRLGRFWVCWIRRSLAVWRATGFMTFLSNLFPKSRRNCVPVISCLLLSLSGCRSQFRFFQVNTFSGIRFASSPSPSACSAATASLTTMGFEVCSGSSSAPTLK